MSVVYPKNTTALKWSARKRPLFPLTLVSFDIRDALKAGKDKEVRSEKRGKVKERDVPG